MVYHQSTYFIIPYFIMVFPWYMSNNYKCSVFKTHTVIFLSVNVYLIQIYMLTAVKTIFVYKLNGRSAPRTVLFVLEHVVKMLWDLEALCTIRATGRWGSDVLAELKGLVTTTEQIRLMLTLSPRAHYRHRDLFAYTHGQHNKSKICEENVNVSAADLCKLSDMMLQCFKWLSGC